MFGLRTKKWEILLKQILLWRQSELVLLLLYGLRSTQSSCTSGSDKTDLATSGRIPPDCWGFANMLMVSTTKWMFNRLCREKRDTWTISSWHNQDLPPAFLKCVKQKPQVSSAENVFNRDRSCAIKRFEHQLAEQPSGLVGRRWAKSAWCVLFQSATCSRSCLSLAGANSTYWHTSVHLAFDVICNQKEPSRNGGHNVCLHFLSPHTLDGLQLFFWSATFRI